jgi:hypothetical protein
MVTSSVIMRRLTAPSSPNQEFAPGDRVLFEYDSHLVRAIVRGIDERAHPQAPFGLPYLVAVIDGDPRSGYAPGRDYTIRAACLRFDGEAPDRAADSVRAPHAAALSRPAVPQFLVAFMREGGTFPQQGAMLVQAATLDEANALATRSLQAELETDIAAGREQDSATVMLLNAAEVTADSPAGVLGQVSW